MTFSPPLRDRLIPWYFVFFFLAVGLIDGVMVFIAVRTETGLVTNHPYEKGLEYNQVVQAFEAQQQLAWQGELTVKAEGASAAYLTFSLRDAQHAPVLLENVTVKCIRPTQKGVDFSSVLQLISPGKAGAHIVFPKPGVWEVRVYAGAHAGQYQHNQRIVIE